MSGSRVGPHPDGACAVAVVAVRRPRHFGYRGGELLHRLRVCGRRHAARAARGAIRAAWRRVRRGLHPRAGHRGTCRQHRSALAVLGRGGPWARERALRLADPAGVAAEGIPHAVLVAARESARRAETPALASRVGRPRRREFPQHAGPCGAADHLGALPELQIRLGRARRSVSCWRSLASARWWCRAR